MRADLHKDPTEVAAMFDQVARRYDVTNDVLSAGLAGHWRRAVVAAVAPRSGERVLDLAAGTLTSTRHLAAGGAHVVGCDFSLGMLTEGRRRQPDSIAVAGDALALPFDDGVFDACTISFGLRNVSDTDRALAEMARVTRSGGRLVVCEFSAPVRPVLRQVYADHLMDWLAKVADRVSSNPTAYRYLAESIRAWPNQEQLAATVGRNGWSGVRYRNLTGGIVALHRARR